MKTATFLLVGVYAVAFATALPAQSTKPRTVWDGAYTEAQAARGDKLYAAECSACHGADMKAGAGAPSLAGPEFTFGWDKKPLAGLFDFVKANMPPGQPGGLRDQEYADILAAVMKRNGFPASAQNELPATKADLESITLIADKP